MSRRRRGRITVQHQPTGGARGMMRFMGAIHATMGLIFVVISLTSVIPGAGLFGLPFLLGGAFFTVNGIRMLVGKNDFAHRVGYDIETGIEEDTIVGIMDEPGEYDPRTETHDHIQSMEPDAKGRLEQLKSLKDAGLLTDQEYHEKRKEIISKL